MKLKREEKLRAISLRKKGYSLAEIVKDVNVAKSSVSIWVRNVEMSNEARSRFLRKITLGQLMAAEAKRARTKSSIDNYRSNALREIARIKFSKPISRLLCAVVYMCEGRKDYFNGVTFTNSDPKLVSLFLKLFREGYDLDERRFRVCVHLHGYHNPEKQIAFWSKVTKIPRGQFIRPYLKPNTGKRIRTNYQGCASVRYQSNDMVRRLLTVSEAFFQSQGIV